MSKLQELKSASMGAFVLGVLLSSCGGNSNQSDQTEVTEDSVAVLSEQVDPLPSTAQKKDAAYGYIAYIQNEGKGEMSETNSVWITDEKGQNARKICTSNDSNRKVFAWKTEGEPCSLTDVLAADEVKIVKNAKSDRVYLVVSGCPDMRNIYSYLIQIDPQSDSCIHIPAAENFEGYKAENNSLCFYNYGYHDEGGRYRYALFYDFNGKLLSKGEPENE